MNQINQYSVAKPNLYLRQTCEASFKTAEEYQQAKEHIEVRINLRQNFVVPFFSVERVKPA